MRDFQAKRSKRIKITQKNLPPSDVCRNFIYLATTFHIVPSLITAMEKSKEKSVVQFFVRRLWADISAECKFRKAEGRGWVERKGQSLQLLYNAGKV